MFIGRPRLEVFDRAPNPAIARRKHGSVESAEVTAEGADGVGSTGRSPGREIESMVDF